MEALFERVVRTVSDRLLPALQAELQRALAEESKKLTQKVMRSLRESIHIECRGICEQLQSSLLESLKTPTAPPDASPLVVAPKVEVPAGGGSQESDNLLGSPSLRAEASPKARAEEDQTSEEGDLFGSPTPRADEEDMEGRRATSAVAKPESEKTPSAAGLPAAVDDGVSYAICEDGEGEDNDLVRSAPLQQAVSCAQMPVAAACGMEDSGDHSEALSPTSRSDEAALADGSPSGDGSDGPEDKSGLAAALSEKLEEEEEATSPLAGIPKEPEPHTPETPEPRSDERLRRLIEQNEAPARTAMWWSPLTRPDRFDGDWEFEEGWGAGVKPPFRRLHVAAPDVTWGPKRLKMDPYCGLPTLLGGPLYISEGKLVHYSKSGNIRLQFARCADGKLENEEEEEGVPCPKKRRRGVAD